MSSSQAVIGNDLRVLVVARLRVQLRVGEGVVVLAGLVGVEPRRLLAVAVEVAARDSLDGSAIRSGQIAVVDFMES